MSIQPQNRTHSASLSTLSRLFDGVCQLLAQPAARASDVARQLGTVVREPEGPLPIVVQPTDPRFREAIVVRRYGTELAEFAMLQSPASPGLSLHTLQAELGEFTELPLVDAGREKELLFRRQQGDICYVVIAQILAKGTTQAQVRSLTIRLSS